MSYSPEGKGGKIDFKIDFKLDSRYELRISHPLNSEPQSPEP